MDEVVLVNLAGDNLLIEMSGPFGVGEMVVGNLLESLVAQEQSGSMTAQLILLVFAAAGLAMVLLSTRKKMVKRARDHQTRQTPRERVRAVEKEAALRNDLNQVMVELDSLSRQIHARIDTKYAKLEAVIRDADERIAKLDAMLKAASDTAPGSLRKLKGESLPSLDTGVRSQLDIQLDEVGPDILDTPAGSVDEPSTGAPSGRQLDRDRVIAMSDKGLSPQQIAEKLGMPLGEVELIVALQRAHNRVS